MKQLQTSHSMYLRETMFDEVIITYIGYIGVKTSMRSLSPKCRSEVAKECINRLCIANNIKRKIEDKPHDCRIDQMLDKKPILTHTGTPVRLEVTSKHLTVFSRDTDQIITRHEMPNVSFASSGDEETVDFVAYVAKNSEFARACFVLKCGYNSGTKVLDSIARGFQKRTYQILSNNNTTINENLDSLKKEHWFHGSNISREQSEFRLKKDGDFLVRGSKQNPEQFVLSVRDAGAHLHLLFDTLGGVRTKDMEFENISDLINYHHKHDAPIVTDDHRVYLRNGVPPN